MIFGDSLCHDTLNGIRQARISLEDKSFRIYFTVNHTGQIARLIPASSNVTNVANRSLNQFERKDVWRKKRGEPMINFAPAETAKTNALFAASLRANKLLYRSYRIVTLCKTMLHRYVEKKRSSWIFYHCIFPNTARKIDTETSNEIIMARSYKWIEVLIINNQLIHYNY